jgi:arylamine N-acetyltransferase
LRCREINGRPMTDAELDAYLQRIHMERPAWMQGAALSTPQKPEQTGTEGTPGAADQAAVNAALWRQVPAAAETRPDYLARLQWAHVCAVPFENLDIMAGRPLTLDRAALFDKIVRRHRGGVCSELNTLYNWLLESLGYEAASYHSRVLSTGVPYPGRSHRLLGVRLGGVTWLTDVGFNYEHMRRPLRLESDTIQNDGTMEYRLQRDEFYGWILWQRIPPRAAAGFPADQPERRWRLKVAFNEEPNIDADYRAATYFAAHHPASMINKQTKVSRYVDDRFLAIRRGSCLTEEHSVVRLLEENLSAARERQLLREVFDLNPPEAGSGAGEK